MGFEVAQHVALSADVRLVSACPTMDLVAVVTADECLSVYVRTRCVPWRSSSPMQSVSLVLTLYCSGPYRGSVYSASTPPRRWPRLLPRFGTQTVRKWLRLLRPWDMTTNMTTLATMSGRCIALGDRNGSVLILDTESVRYSRTLRSHAVKPRVATFR